MTEENIELKEAVEVKDAIEDESIEINVVALDEVKSLITKNIEDKNSTSVKFDGFKIFGNEEQKISIMKDFTSYFSEVSNPKNTKMNLFTKAKYAPLDEVLNAVRPILGEFNIGIMQVPNILEDGKVGVDTLITHKNGGMISIQGIYIKPKKDDAQEIGSVITYVRRYTLCSVLGVSSEEDDDGNDGSGKKIKSTPDKDITEVTFVTLKARIQSLAKEKDGEGKDSRKLISEVLGKGLTVTKAKEEDKEKLVELYNKLSEL